MVSEGQVLIRWLADDRQRAFRGSSLQTLYSPSTPGVCDREYLVDNQRMVQDTAESLVTIETQAEPGHEDRDSLLEAMVYVCGSTIHLCPT